MASKDETAHTPIAPHYYLVQEEFARLSAKLEIAMMRPARPMGLEIVDCKAALKIWEQSLWRCTRKLPSLFRSFSTTLLVRNQRPSSGHTQRALIPIEQEVNRLIALHRQLWQQPFSQNFQEGQALLSRCIEKIAADLHDLFTCFITTVESSTGKLSVHPITHVWDKEINCRVEMAEFWSWLRNVIQLPSLIGRLADSVRFVLGLIYIAEVRYVETFSHASTYVFIKH